MLNLQQLKRERAAVEADAGLPEGAAGAGDVLSLHLDLGFRV